MDSFSLRRFIVATANTRNASTDSRRLTAARNAPPARSERLHCRSGRAERGLAPMRAKRRVFAGLPVQLSDSHAHPEAPGSRRGLPAVMFEQRPEIRTRKAWPGSAC